MPQATTRCARWRGVLESCARRDDVLGRLGGDEFGWLLPGATPDDAVAAAERALRMAAAVQTAAGDGALSLTAGIAVALTAVDGETLFERADGALREGKLAGRGVARLVGADRPRRQRQALEAQRPQELLTTAARSVPELAELAVVEWSAVFRASACALSLIEGDMLRTIAFCAGLHRSPSTTMPTSRRTTPRPSRRSRPGRRARSAPTTSRPTRASSRSCSATTRGRS